MASGDLDAFTVSWDPKLVNYIFTEGQLQPLNELLDKYGANFKKAIPDSAWKVTSANGKIMGVPQPAPVVTWVAPFIRKDLMDKAGVIKLPETIDEYESALYAIKKADPSIIPLTSDYFAWIMYNTLGGEAIPASETDKDGNLLPYVRDSFGLSWYYKSPEFKSHLQRMAKWYKDGIINKEIFTWKSEKNLEAVNTGKVAAVAGGIWTIDNFDRLGGLLTSQPLKDNEVKQDWVVLPNMKDSRGTYAQMVYGDQPDRFIGIPSGSKNAALVMQYLDWLAEKPENTMIARFGIEGKHYQKVDGEKIKVTTTQGATTPDLGKSYDLCGYIFNKQLEQMKVKESPNTSYFRYMNPNDVHGVASIDQFVLYNSTKFGIKMNDYTTLFDQTIQKIVLGVTDISELDKMSQKLDSMGYQDVLKEINTQFRKFTGK